jgi:hypothetical protein
VWEPDVPKGSSVLTRLKKDPTRPIREHVYFWRVQKTLHRCAPKVIPIGLLLSRKAFIEVRILLEGNTLLALATVEIPKNFCCIRTVSE